MSRVHRVSAGQDLSASTALENGLVLVIFKVPAFHTLWRVLGFYVLSVRLLLIIRPVSVWSAWPNGNGCWSSLLSWTLRFCAAPPLSRLTASIQHWLWCLSCLQAGMANRVSCVTPSMLLPSIITALELVVYADLLQRRHRLVSASNTHRLVCNICSS